MNECSNSCAVWKGANLCQAKTGGEEKSWGEQSEEEFPADRQELSLSCVSCVCVHVCETYHV